MSIPTYTAIGNFTDPNIFSLDICIPAEDVNNPYLFDNFDMSKLDANNQQINVVFSHVMKINDDGSEWRATGYDFHLDISLPISKTFPAGNPIAFDPNIQAAMYILFHNNFEVNQQELQWIYDNIDSLYDKVKTGNFNMVLPILENSISMLKPNRLGLSLLAS